MTTRQWRFKAVAAFPKRLIAAEPPAAGSVFPARFEVVAVSSGERRVGDVSIGLRPVSSAQSDPRIHLSQQAGELFADIEAASPLDAIEHIRPMLDLVIDRLSFDMQAAVSIVGIEMIDVTPPVSVNDERPFMSFTGYPGDKFAPVVDLGAAKTIEAPRLADKYADPGRRVRAALRWYIKSLAANYLDDRFMCLWVAAEIFADRSGVQVREAKRFDCGHSVNECPVCQAPTQGKIRGASMKAYLGERGLDVDVANKAWKLRQMMHGAIDFDSLELSYLPIVSQKLRAIVADELKLALGIRPSALPIVTAGVPAIAPVISVGGTSKVAAADLER